MKQGSLDSDTYLNNCFEDAYKAFEFVRESYILWIQQIIIFFIRGGNTVTDDKIRAQIEKSKVSA